jgi:hypothetical protein
MLCKQIIPVFHWTNLVCATFLTTNNPTDSWCVNFFSPSTWEISYFIFAIYLVLQQWHATLRKLFKWLQYTSEIFLFNNNNRRNIRHRILLWSLLQYVIPIPNGVAHYGKANLFGNVPTDYLHVNNKFLAFIE